MSPGDDRHSALPTRSKRTGPALLSGALCLALAALPELAHGWDAARRQRAIDALVELLHHTRETERAWLQWRWSAH